MCLLDIHTLYVCTSKTNFVYFETKSIGNCSVIFIYLSNLETHLKHFLTNTFAISQRNRVPCCYATFVIVVTVSGVAVGIEPATCARAVYTWASLIAPDIN